ncbi:MAG: FGGY family carbohydrate kinase [Saccharospirillum sp.]|uniref:FGGY-family carbohydrate kinase n=1 Tax=Saccharospirillum sp. TaxID=2033801 RepID=UPI00329692CC
MSVTVTVVFDIGKTNLKLCALDLATGAIVASLRTTNDVCYDGLYPHADVNRCWRWLCEGLVELGKSWAIRSIGITTHGATAACLAGDELVLPVLDYEHPGIDSTADTYHKVRPDFAETRSPGLPAGLNLGAQLYWLENTHRETFSQVTRVLTYPQYWGWRLSGVAASEVTSLGCHTDLWNPARSDFSSLVDSQRWRSLFPPLVATGSGLGSLLPELASELGLDPDCVVYNGIHDSNASLVPHLLKLDAPFGVVSSGTWAVIAGVGAPLNSLDQNADMLANVNAFGDPVPCIRFMGGREWETLRGSPECSWQDVVDVLQLQVYAIPSFVDQGGPFQNQQGRFTGPVQRLNETQKTALATLYVALMTDYCLERLQQRGDIIVEGAFAASDCFLTALSTLRPHQAVLKSTDATGTTMGTAMLSNPEAHWDMTYEKQPGSPDRVTELLAYRDHWVQLLPSV